MFRADQDYYYYEASQIIANEHLLDSRDIFSFHIYARSGFEIIDVLSSQPQITQRIQYEVDSEGNVDFPVLGILNVNGLTIRQLKKVLEEKYSLYFNEPFVVLEILNRRVFYFTGIGNASVINLPTENVNVLEFIALAGGIPAGSKAYRIRLIRGNLENPTIYMIDLSTLSGLKEASTLVRSNDIIIIEPSTKLAPILIREITPILSLLTTLTTIILLANNLSN